LEGFDVTVTLDGPEDRQLFVECHRVIVEAQGPKTPRAVLIDERVHA
jgi:hypothetical protein